MDSGSDRYFATSNLRLSVIQTPKNFVLTMDTDYLDYLEGINNVLNILRGTLIYFGVRNS